MKKAIKIVLFGVLPTLILSAAIFSGIYFGIDRNKEKPFSLFITDINPWDMGKVEWLADFNYFFKLIRDNYPFLTLKERTHGYNWLDLQEYYLNRLENISSNGEFLELIYDAVNALQNRHTQIINPYDINFLRDLFNSISEGLGFDYVPYTQIFTDEIELANSYWLTRYNTLTIQREWLMYDALILYDHGKYIIHGGYANWVELYGNNSKIIAVNNEPIDELISTLYERSYIDWDFLRAKPYVHILIPSLFGADALFTIQNETGFEKDVTFNCGYYSYSNPLKYPSPSLSTALLNDNKTGYIYCGTFMPENFTREIEILEEFYQTINNCDELIIDIRGNGGGFTNYGLFCFYAYLAQLPELVKIYLAFRSGEYVQYFREGNFVNITVPKSAISSLPPEVLTSSFQLYNSSFLAIPHQTSINFEGAIKLLVDPYVYSAAEFFTVFCKLTGFASIYGTTTGGDGIGVTPMYYVLPNSKLVIRISCCLGIDSFGQANEEARTQPDYYYESTYGNWSELIDYASKH